MWLIVNSYTFGDHFSIITYFLLWTGTLLWTFKVGQMSKEPLRNEKMSYSCNISVTSFNTEFLDSMNWIKSLKFMWWIWSVYQAKLQLLCQLFLGPGVTPKIGTRWSSWLMLPSIKYLNCFRKSSTRTWNACILTMVTYHFWDMLNDIALKKTREGER